MNRKKLDQILEQRASSPTPRLQPDPFLPTRIRALARGRGEEISPFAGLSWTMRSMLAGAALIVGIYVGGHLSPAGNPEPAGYGDDAFTSLASAISPRSLSDDIVETLLTGEVEDE